MISQDKVDSQIKKLKILKNINTLYVKFNFEKLQKKIQFYRFANKYYSLDLYITLKLFKEFKHLKIENFYFELQNKKTDINFEIEFFIFFVKKYFNDFKQFIVSLPNDCFLLYDSFKKIFFINYGNFNLTFIKNNDPNKYFSALIYYLIRKININTEKIIITSTSFPINEPHNFFLNIKRLKQIKKIELIFLQDYWIFDSDLYSRVMGNLNYKLYCVNKSDLKLNYFLTSFYNVKNLNELLIKN